MKYRLIEDVNVTGVFAQDLTSTIFDIGSAGGDSLSIQAVLTDETPGNETFQAGVSAALTNQSLTYTAASHGVAGNAITVALVNPGTPSASLSVAVVGSAITVNLATDSGSSITSTGNDVKAAIIASAPASALVTMTGTNASVVTAVTATHLSGGLDTTVNTVNSTVTITAHGYTTGLSVELTTAGTLPTGLSTSTQYFLIVVDANTIKFATSLDNANAGTAISLTGTGTGLATIAPDELATASIALYKSNNATDWVAEGNPVSISDDGDFVIAIDRPLYRYYKYVVALATGALGGTIYTLVKGDVT